MYGVPFPGHPFSFFGGIQRIAYRMIDDTCDGNAVLEYRDRDSEHRNTVEEVGGTVERIYYPLKRRGALLLFAFFRENSVIGKMLFGHLEYRGLGLLVGGGHEAFIGFDFAPDRGLEVIEDHTAAFFCRFDGNVK